MAGADINVRTIGLKDFAADSRFDIDVGTVRGLVAAASGASSQLVQGAQFHQTHPALMQKVVDVLERFQANNETYRQAARTDASIFDTTDAVMGARMGSVPAASASHGEATSSTYA